MIAIIVRALGDKKNIENVILGGQIENNIIHICDTVGTQIFLLAVLIFLVG